MHEEQTEEISLCKTLFGRYGLVAAAAMAFKARGGTGGQSEPAKPVFRYGWPRNR